MNRRRDSAARRASALVWLGVMALALSVLTAAGPLLHRRLGGWALIGIFIVAAMLAAAAARIAERAPSAAALGIVLGAAAVMRGAMLIAQPSLSSDVYRYVWDGRVQAAGINPYRYVPLAPELTRLRDSAIFPNINRASYAPTIYPPVAQLIFLAITRLSESVLAMRIGMLAFEALGCAALILLLRGVGLPSTRVALYAWHPLPIWEIAGNGHIDAAMVALLLVGLCLAAKQRVLASAVAVTLGALTKPTAALALPALWQPWDWRLPLLVAATALLAYLPYLSAGWGVFGFLSGYFAEEGMTNGNGYKLLALVQSITGELPHAATIYIALSVLLLLLLALATAFRRDRAQLATLTAISWLLTAFLVLSSPHYPWYFLPLVPFLALNATATMWVLTVASVLFYNAVPEVGALPSYDARIRCFTLLLLLALAYDMWARGRTPSPTTIGGTP
jgi:alpha-1,6-mannosyltransferase